IYVLDGKGLVNQTIDANGNSSFSEFDEDSNLVSETDGSGLTTTYSYDERGDRTSVVLPDGATHSTTFKDGLPIMATNPAGATTIWQYDEKRHLVSKIDPQGQVTKYGYEKGLLHSVTELNRGETTLSYD